MNIKRVLQFTPIVTYANERFSKRAGDFFTSIPACLAPDAPADVTGYRSYMTPNCFFLLLFLSNFLHLFYSLFLA